MAARRIVTGSLIWLIALAGCSATGSSVPEVHAADAAPAIEGEHYEVVTVWSGGSPGTGTRRPEVLLPDGSAIGVEVPPDHLVHDVFEAPSRVGVMTGDEFAPFDDTSTLLPEHGHRGVTEVAHSGGVTAWFESPSIQGSPRWRLFVHDGGGTRLLLAEEEIVEQVPDIGTWGVRDLEMSDDRAFFAGGDSLVSLAVDGTDLRVGPLPDDVVQGEVEVVARADGGSDLLVSGSGGPVTIRGDGPVVGDVVACGTLLVWTLGDDVAGETARLMLFDRTTAELWRVGEANPFGTVMCAGDLMSYTRLDPDPDRFADTIVLRWTA